MGCLPHAERTDAPPPDPSRGVFETLLVAGGRPLELEAHMARLEASVRGLFGAEPPPAARVLTVERAGEAELGRLRVDVAPGPDGTLGAEARLAEVERALVFPSWERALTLAPVVVPGGIGAHKWSDRRLLDQAEADRPGALALVLDEDGTVLEVSRGNVFLVRDEAVSTPPADGRLLPGIARLRLFDVARTAEIAVREEVVSVDDLAAADEVFVSGSVRGVEPVRAYADVREWAPGTLTQAVSDALRHRWLGEPERD